MGQLMVWALSFDAFKTHGSSMDAPVEVIKETSGVLFTASNYVAIWASIISLALLGISFAVHGGDAQRFSENKLWGMRLIAIIIFILGLIPKLLDWITSIAL